MPDCIIENLADGRLLNLGLNGPRAQFILRSEAISGAALEDLQPEAVDLLDIAAAVFYADGSISRGGNVRTNMGALWHRNLRLTIPVRRLALWQSSEVATALSQAVNFLTGDNFEFSFVAAGADRSESGFLDLDRQGAPFGADHVILFSGGIDSFAGALDTLATGTGHVILVSHRSANKVSDRQDLLAKYLIDRFGKRVRHIKVKAHRKGQESTDTTQRSRSFLFAAIGAAVAQAFRAKRISFFENGVVSHNLPISPQITGTMATRTTHPLVMHRLSKLISLILPDLPGIANPFEWLTKTEVAQRVQQHGAEQMFGHAVSCTHVRDQTTLHTHCGTCSQCQDRRFAVLFQGLQRYDRPESYATDVMTGPRKSDAERTMAVEWTRHSLRIAGFSEKEFYSKFGTEISLLMDGYPEQPQQQIFGRILELHQRQARIVLGVLTKAFAEHSSDLANTILPSTCLLALHAGQGAYIAQSPVVESSLVHNTGHLTSDEESFRFDPDAPPVLEFRLSNGRHEVTIRGLCDLRGNPARVAHHLKVPFDEDRAEGLAHLSHRFVPISRLEGVTMSKENVRTAVKNCRKAIGEACQHMSIAPAPMDLVIQSGPNRGYRLNPLSQIIEGDG